MARLRSITWLAEDRIAEAVRLESVLVLLILAAGSWICYKIFLRRVSRERHEIFSENFRNLSLHVGIGLAVFGIYEALYWGANERWLSIDLSSYVGLLAIVSGCVVLVKTFRIYAYHYLFLTSMKAGVPLLIVNILTLVFSLILGGVVLSRYVGIDLTPLLATSAIFSIVLGLALQDTLGNLFAGIALQIDKPFELGDWIELKNGNDKVSGQVLEVTWRATLLQAITDELITIPNRSMAQWQISNFAGRKRPFVRSHVIKLPYDAPVDLAKAILLSAASSVPGVVSNPPPVVIATESSDHGVVLKVVYNIVDYGSQFGIADRFLTIALDELSQAGIKIAAQRLTIEERKTS